MITMFFLTAICFAQVVEVKGTVLDAEYGEEPLAFADVKVNGTELEVVTDENGFYELNLLPGIYTLEFEFIGYDTKLISEIEITESGVQLDPVILGSKKFSTDEGIVLSENNLASKED